MPAVKDCFGLHGHYAFGSVAKEKSGVGRKSATSVGLTTDLVHWLQAGKTVAVVRFASKIHRLASAFRTASVASLPAAIPSRPPCGGPTDRLAPVIVLPLWFFVFIVAVMRIVWDVINQKGGGCSVVLLLLVFLYHISRQENVIPLYIVLMLLKIWRLLIIPRFAEILGLPARPAVQGLRCRALTTSYSVSAVRG